MGYEDDISWNAFFIVCRSIATFGIVGYYKLSKRGA